MFGVFEVSGGSYGEDVNDYTLIEQHISLNSIRTYGYINKYEIMNCGYIYLSNKNVIIFDNEFNHTYPVFKSLIREMVLQEILD